MTGAWPVAQVRAAEEKLMSRLPTGALMQRAAAGLATVGLEELPRVYGAQIALLIGAGNNGGDALFAGARLASRGARVEAILLNPQRVHTEGLSAFRAAGGHVSTDNERVVREAALVIDGIVGIGGHGALRSEAAHLAAIAADASGLCVAVDVPSGIDTDTGNVPGDAFRADITVTFGCLKPGLLVDPGRQYAGDVRVIDIGLTPYLPEDRITQLRAAEVARMLRWPDPNDHKYRRGVVGLVAGSAKYAGAAVLTAGGAVHGLAGMVRYVGSSREQVLARWPQVVTANGPIAQIEPINAWVVGPGLGIDDAGRQALREVLETDKAVLVDADGITLLAEEPDLVRRRTATTVLTPHDGEFRRLAGDLASDRIGAARACATDLGATVLLKGNATIVAEPAGRVYVNPTGTPWLATAGAGDVLSGLAGSLLAAGIAPARAAACAAWLHGLAGQLAGPVAGSDHVISALPAAFRHVASLRSFAD